MKINAILKDDVSATRCHHYQMQMKQTIGNESVKHNIKFEEQKSGIIKDHKVKIFAGKESF